MTKQSRHDLLVILEYIYLNFYMENCLAFKLLKKLSTGRELQMNLHNVTCYYYMAD